MVVDAQLLVSAYYLSRAVLSPIFCLNDFYLISGQYNDLLQKINKGDTYNANDNIKGSLISTSCACSKTILYRPDLIGG